MYYKASVDRINGYNVNLFIEDQTALKFFNKNFGKEINIQVKQFRECRSLNANSYMWVLLTQIADVLKSDKWSVYLEMLKRYSKVYDYVIVPKEAVEKFTQALKKDNESRMVVDLGAYKVTQTDGTVRECEQLQIYYGSSEFDTKEMSVLLNGVVDEAKLLGIETMTPAELNKLKEIWKT